MSKLYAIVRGYAESYKIVTLSSDLEKAKLIAEVESKLFDPCRIEEFEEPTSVAQN